MSSLAGDDSCFGSGFLSAAGDADDVLRLAGFETAGVGEDVSVLDMSERCSDLQITLH